jgi:hypothetical protein
MLEPHGAFRLGENVTLQMRDWQEAIDFFAEIPAEAIDLQHFGRTPVPGRSWTPKHGDEALVMPW